MMRQYTDEALLQSKIDDSLNDGMDQITKKTIVRSMRAESFSSQKRASSFSTITSISNAMVGTSTLVFPILYNEVGIISAITVSILIACISTKTCHIQVEHNKYNEVYYHPKNQLDMPDTILRILGLRWQKLYNCTNVILLYLSGMIYMILICNQIYPLLCLILDHFKISYADQKVITLSQISYQWSGIGYFFIIFPLMCLRNLGFILKLVPLGIVSVVTFFFFIIYKGTQNIVLQGFSIFSQLKLVSTDLLQIAGVFTLGLMVQSLVVPIVKNNRNQINNKRDIGIAFGWTWFVYQIVGIFGAISIAGIQTRPGTKGDIVLDFFDTDWMVILVQVLLLFQLTFVFPVLQFVTRAQFFVLVNGLNKPPAWQFYGFTLFYALSCLFMQMAEANLSLIISLCGAVIGMFQIYIIPIILHLTCLYQKRTNVQEEERVRENIQTNSRLSQTLMDTNQGLLENVDLSVLGFDDEDVKCNKHDQIINLVSRRSRLIFYYILITFGTFVGVGRVINVIYSASQ